MQAAADTTQFVTAMDGFSSSNEAAAAAAAKAAVELMSALAAITSSSPNAALSTSPSSPSSSLVSSRRMSRSAPQTPSLAASMSMTAAFDTIKQLSIASVASSQSPGLGLEISDSPEAIFQTTSPEDRTANTSDASRSFSEAPQTSVPNHTVTTTSSSSPSTSISTGHESALDRPWQPCTGGLSLSEHLNRMQFPHTYRDLANDWVRLGRPALRSLRLPLSLRFAPASVFGTNASKNSTSSMHTSSSSPSLSSISATTSKGLPDLEGMSQAQHTLLIDALHPYFEQPQRRGASKLFVAFASHLDIFAAVRAELAALEQGLNSQCQDSLYEATWRSLLQDFEAERTICSALPKHNCLGQIMWGDVYFLPAEEIQRRFVAYTKRPIVSTNSPSLPLSPVRGSSEFLPMLNAATQALSISSPPLGKRSHQSAMAPLTPLSPPQAFEAAHDAGYGWKQVEKQACCSNNHLNDSTPYHHHSRGASMPAVSFAPNDHHQAQPVNTYSAASMSTSTSTSATPSQYDMLADHGYTSWWSASQSGSSGLLTPVSLPPSHSNDGKAPVHGLFHEASNDHFAQQHHEGSAAHENACCSVGAGLPGFQHADEAAACDAQANDQLWSMWKAFEQEINPDNLNGQFVASDTAGSETVLSGMTSVAPPAIPRRRPTARFVHSRSMSQLHEPYKAPLTHTIPLPANELPSADVSVSAATGHNSNAPAVAAWVESNNQMMFGDRPQQQQTAADSTRGSASPYPRKRLINDDDEEKTLSSSQQRWDGGIRIPKSNGLRFEDPELDDLEEDPRETSKRYRFMLEDAVKQLHAAARLLGQRAGEMQGSSQETRDDDAETEVATPTPRSTKTSIISSRQIRRYSNRPMHNRTASGLQAGRTANRPRSMTTNAIVQQADDAPAA